MRRRTAQTETPPTMGPMLFPSASLPEVVSAPTTGTGGGATGIGGGATGTGGGGDGGGDGGGGGGDGGGGGRYRDEHTRQPEEVVTESEDHSIVSGPNRESEGPLTPEKLVNDPDGSGMRSVS